MKEKIKTIKKIEEELSFQVDSEEIPPEDIFAYNELRSAADLYRMYKDGVLEIKPDFQREVVWKDTDQTRFIDSLMKQLPIPSMCFSLDHRTQQWKVVDGLQRMYTITRFLGEESWKLSKLSDINKNISGKNNHDIKKEFPDLYKRVQNITLPVTILRCDYGKESHAEYMFMVFHRLNAGGLKLNNQEIRNAVYSGPFNDFLKDCNKNKIWRKLLGAKDETKDRFRKIELILRFFAFLDDHTHYNGKLTSFLNSYMFKKRRREEDIPAKSKIFNDTVELIYNKISDKESLSNSKSNVIIEALMFGVAKNINSLKNVGIMDVKRRYKRLINHDLLSETSIREAIMKKEKVTNRLNVAKNIFSKAIR